MGIVRWAGVLVRLQSGGRRSLGTVLYATVLFLAALVLASGLYVRSNIAQRWDAAALGFGPPDVVVTSRSTNALAEISQIEGVASVGWRLQMLHGVSIGRISPNPGEPIAVNARMVMANTQPVAMIRSGRWLTPSDVTGVVLDDGLAQNLGLRVGDKVTVHRETRATEVEVVGTALDFTNCLASDCTPSNVWVSPKLQSVLGSPGWNVFVEGFTFDKDMRAEQLVTKMMTAERSDIRVVTSANEVRDAVVIRNGLLGSVVAGFGLFALLASSIIVSSITSIRLSQMRRDLGLLQLVGATPRSVLGVVLIQNMVIGFICGMSGWCAAWLVRNRLILGAARLLPEADGQLSSSVIVVVGVVLLIVVVGTLFASIGVLRLEPLMALRGRAEPGKVEGRSRAARVPSSVLTMCERMLRTQRRHLLVALLALIVTATASVAASGFDAALIAFASGDQHIGAKVDTQITPTNEAEANRVDTTLARSAIVDAWWKETFRQVLANRITAQARFVDGSIQDVGFTLAKGRYPIGPGESVIGYGLAKRGNILLGDTITVVAEHRSFTTLVVGQIVDGSNAGRSIVMPMADLPIDTRWNIRRSIRFTSQVDRAAAAVEVRLLAGLLKEQSQSGGIRQNVTPYRGALYLLAAAVLMVGLCQLVASLVLMLKAASRDHATLRAIGVRDSHLVWAQIIVTLLVVLIAALLALPLGWLAYRSSVTSVAKSVGIGPGVVLPSPVGRHVVVSTILCAVAVVITAATASRQLALPLISSLRAD